MSVFHLDYTLEEKKMPPIALYTKGGRSTLTQCTPKRGSPYKGDGSGTEDTGHAGRSKVNVNWERRNSLAAGQLYSCPGTNPKSVSNLLIERKSLTTGLTTGVDVISYHYHRQPSS